MVTVRYEDGSEETLTLVGPLEADISRGCVSSEPPAGQALLGKAAIASHDTLTTERPVKAAMAKKQCRIDPRH